MKTFFPHGFGQLYGILRLVAAKPSKLGEDSDLVSEGFKFVMLPFLSAHEKTCDEVGLKTSAITIRKLIELFSKPNCTMEEFRRLAEVLEGRFADEMEATQFLALNMREAECYRNPRVGWEKIVERFPSIVSDVEEAYKCFALSRYAAAVFHSLQSMEFGIVKLGRFLEVPDFKEGWEPTLKRVRAIIQTPIESRSEFEKQHYDFLVQAEQRIQAWKTALRDTVSHVAARPRLKVAVFSPEMTEEILMASRSFMGWLADGLPTAEV